MQELRSVARGDNNGGAYIEPSGRNWWHGDDGLVDQWPYVPGKQYVDWDLTDPAGKGQDEVRAIRDEIERRVGELPL